MNISEFQNIQELPKDVKPFLLKNEIQNNRVIGLINLLEMDPNNFKKYSFWIVTDNTEKTIGLAIWIQSKPLVFSAQSHESADLIIRAIDDRISDYSSLHGLNSLLEPLIKKYLLQNIYPTSDQQRCYQLTQVTWPKKVLDSVRVANISDSSFLLQANDNFGRECNISPNSQGANEWLNRHLKNNNLYVGIKNNEIVCCGLIGLYLPNGRIISFIYTPQALRGQGFASDFIAQLSQIVLDMGNSYVCLYTQLANPTSNKIYQNVGYKPENDYLSIKK